MPHVDQIVLALLLSGLIASIAYQWRQGARGVALAAAALAAFYGVTLVTMLGAHCADVLWGLTHRLKSMTGAPFAYDWRTYSLLLFGALLVTLGARALGAALAMGRGEPGARAAFLRVAALVVAIVAPIIPIHAFFGWLISGASALTMLVVAAAGARVRAPSVAGAVGSLG
jgi:hypothetical protein